MQTIHNDNIHGDEHLTWHDSFDEVSIADVIESIAIEKNTADGHSSYDWMKIIALSPETFCNMFEHIARNKNKPEFAFLIGQMENAIEGYLP